MIALSELLKQQSVSVGIVSRGYGGDFSGEKVLTGNDKASSVGDEPCLLRQRTGLPVVVGANRPAAVQHLLEAQACDLILSDDGLQHYRLQRDLEIAVVDADRGLGNGFCLPAGPLRERSGRLDEVDIIAWHRTSGSDTANDTSFTLEFSDAVNLLTGETRTVESFSGTTIHAIAGIGHPARFFRQLEVAGLTLIRHAFTDHHAYSPADLDFGDNKAILMTEKDAVKCRAFATDNLWYVPVVARLSEQLSHRFLSEVTRLVDGKGDA